MNPEIRATNMALTQLSKQIDELYHRYGAYCGLADPAIGGLYSLYEKCFGIHRMSLLRVYDKRFCYG